MSKGGKGNSGCLHTLKSSTVRAVNDINSNTNNNGQLYQNVDYLSMSNINSGGETTPSVTSL